MKHAIAVFYMILFNRNLCAKQKFYNADKNVIEFR